MLKLLEKIKIDIQNRNKFCIEEWEKLCKSIEEIGQYSYYPEVYYIIGSYYLEIDELTKAIEFYKKSWDSINKNHIYNDWFIYGLIVRLHEILGITFAKQGDYQQSLYYFKNYIHHKFRNPIIVAREVNCFSFRAINEYTINDLINNQITVVSPKLFNDPSDPPLFSWISYAKKLADYDLTSLEHACKGLNIRCFVSNYGLAKIYDSSKKICRKTHEYRNYLMWSHYANSHEGICIEYYFAPEFFDVNKTENGINTWEDVKYVGKVSIKSTSMIDNALTTKYNVWKYENEIRLIHYDPENDQDYKVLKLSTQCKICSIYFGVNCSEEEMKKIYKSLKDKKVNLYRMHIDPANIYMLKEEKIDFE